MISLGKLVLHSGSRRVLGLEGGQNLDEQGEGGRVSCNVTHFVLAQIHSGELSLVSLFDL